MSSPIKLQFLFGGSAIHDASVSQTSDPLKICFNHRWSMFPEVVGLDAVPLYTIEVSNDGVSWDAYDTRAQNAAINQPFDDTHMNFLYARIVYNATTNTSGTASFYFILK